MGKYILRNIEPFNDVFFKSCYYNSFFPVLKHFKREPLEFLANSTNVYRLNNGNRLKLDTEYIDAKPAEVIVEEMGIGTNVSASSSDVINHTISSISANRPVVLWVDSFYESVRPDTYLKLNWLHTLLVYGFDEQKQVFYIIEHDHKDNLTYEHRELSFFDVKKSFEGYVDNFQDKWGFPAFNEYFCKVNSEIENTDKSSMEELYSLYLQNINRNKDLIVSRIDCIKDFAVDFKSMVLNKLALDENLDIVLNNLNVIINSKLVEKYLMLSISGYNDILHEAADRINEVIDCWTYIRAALARYKYSLIYKQESLEYSIPRLMQIYEYEQSCYRKLLNYE